MKEKGRKMKEKKKPLICIMFVSLVSLVYSEAGRKKDKDGERWRRKKVERKKRL